MSSQGESSDSCPDSEEVAGAVAEISQSNPSEHSDEENCSHKSSISTIWYFEGTITMDLPPDDWNDGEMPDRLDTARHFNTDYFKKPPVPITCMLVGMDFSKANWGEISGRTFTAPICKHTPQAEMSGFLGCTSGPAPSSTE